MRCRHAFTLLELLFTVAIIAGVLAGALSGISAVPQDLYRDLENVNHLGLAQWADKLQAIACQLHPGSE